MVELKITFLGTSAAIPTFQRGLSSTVLIRGSELLIFDAGEGMQLKFMKSRIGMNKKMKIFITHIHGDHCLGLLGLLQTLSLLGRTKPVEIFGEPRIKEFVLINHKILNFNLNFQVNIHEIKNEGIVVNEKDYCIKACFADHSILSYSYLIEECSRPGVFDVEKARKLGIPEGELYHMLQHGIDIEHEGRKVYAKQFTGPSRQGRKIGISGDTRPSLKLQQFFKGCDVLIFESTFSSIEQQKAIERYHSTAVEASLFAKNAKVKKLILTHFSSRYDDLNLLKYEALKIFENVHIARDLEFIQVRYPC